jgi:hypothetical protein
MSYKVPVARRADYTIYVQDINGETWVHCDVKNWGCSVAKNLRRDTDVLYGMHGGPVYALNEPAGCKKHQKFLAMMGFEFFKELPSKIGTQYIFKR